MYPRKRYIEFTFILLISLSGTLIGLSHDNDPLMWTAITGAIVSFLLVDYLRLFHLSGWLANIASVLILLFAMRDFFGGDSAVKLISVAELLVYLQCVLVFQEKTPRLYWQILVLSLLQVVVAAIFNLNFEGGLFFMCYFAVAMAAMMMQNDFTHWTENRLQNQDSIRQQEALVLSLRGGQQTNASTKPCLVSPPRQNFLIGRMIGQLFPWLLASFAFATVLFYLVPRAEEAWVGPGMRRVVATGSTKRVNLDERGVIRQNDALVFRVTYTDMGSGESVMLSGPPYFRGMPLPRLVIENGMTQWKAPHDSVFEFCYRTLPEPDLSANFGNQCVELNQKIVLEGTVDPLLYASMPVYRPRPIDDRCEFCGELSALTRRRKGDLTEMSSYKYELKTRVGLGYRPLNGWPYLPKRDASPLKSLDDAPGEKAGLVYLDPNRYPVLVENANRIADETGTENKIELCESLTRYFTESQRFKYTMDFTEVTRDPAIDPIEDFFANHRSGHCELFASALTLMLRSQGIPARLVLGFHGGEFNKLASCYMVRGRQAHAWVEAYIPPWDCTDEMRQKGIAGPRGCWLTLDPTPPTDNAGGNEALDLARTFWQDYVLSMDEDQQEEIADVSTSGIFSFLNFGRLRPLVNQSLVQVRDRPELQGLFVFVIVLVAVVLALIQRRDSKADRKTASRTVNVSRFRQLIGSALSVISPKLGALVLPDDLRVIPSVPFYRRMTRAMARLGLVRAPDQTQREFAVYAIDQLSSSEPIQSDRSDQGSSIAEDILKVTDRFYQVRFGNRALDNEGLRDIERTVERLENELRNVKRVPVPVA